MSSSLWPHGLQQVTICFSISSRVAQTHVHWVSDAIQPSHPLSPLLLPSIFPSIRVFSHVLALHIRWPKYWSCSFSISPSNEYSGLISSRIDWYPSSPRDSQEFFSSTTLWILFCHEVHTLDREIKIWATRWNNAIIPRPLPTTPSHGSVVKNRRYRFNPWVGNIPWRRAEQPTPVFLPGKSHGQRSVVGYSP